MTEASTEVRPNSFLLPTKTRSSTGECGDITEGLYILLIRYRSMDDLGAKDKTSGIELVKLLRVRNTIK